MQRLFALALTILLLATLATQAQRYSGSDGRLRVALAKQPFSPTGISPGSNTMANGGIQQVLQGMGIVVRIEEAALTPAATPKRRQLDSQRFRPRTKEGSVSQR